MGMTGGCMCGSVRYELKSEPFDCGWCHCRTCQLSSGTPAQAFASLKRGDWVPTKGKDSIRMIRSSSFGQRYFCGTCGTPLYVTVDHQPDVNLIRAAVTPRTKAILVKSPNNPTGAVYSREALYEIGKLAL